jgi:hypothetical protein
MSVTTTADEHIDRAKEYIEKARKEIGEVLVDTEMWSANDYRPGYLRNCFWRVDALLRPLKGQDQEGERRVAEIPPV